MCHWRMSNAVNDMIDRDIHKFSFSDLLVVFEKLQELYELKKREADELRHELAKAEAQLKLWKGTGL